MEDKWCDGGENGYNVLWFSWYYGCRRDFEWHNDDLTDGMDMKDIMWTNFYNERFLFLLTEG